MSGIKDGELDDAELRAVLQMALSRLHLELTSPSTVPVGMPVTASIAGASTEVDVTDLLNGVLDLAWLTYNSVDVGKIDPSSLAAEQIATAVATALPTAKSAATQKDLKGIVPPVVGPTGLLSRLLGVVGQPRLRVRVDIQWRLTDQNGNDWIPGKDFLAPSGLTLPSITLRIPPLFRDLRLDDGGDVGTLANPQGCTYYLSAEIALSVGDVSVPATLPSEAMLGIPIIVLPILLPTVVVLFSNPQFSPYHPKPGLSLIIVPHHSAFASLEQLSKLLDDLNKKIEPLRDLASFAAVLLGLDALTEAINTHPAVRFVTAQDAPDPKKETGAQGVSDLTKIVYWKNPTKIAWITLWTDDVTINDATNSALMLGLPGTVVRFYIRRFYEMKAGDKDNGAFDIFIPDVIPGNNPLSVVPFTLVPNFGNLDPMTAATTGIDKGHMFGVHRTIPRGRSKTAGGGWVADPGDLGTAWCNKISSVTFESFGVENQCPEVQLIPKPRRKKRSTR
ncbi:hypothetical protein [Burkholderia cepacia]|uniref:hypothetical protein n=1 Tax=Burkholderia cepacia TaxID=292 RepID=UPI0012963CE2|nr:hypothetical protein [Burkholderia cepacia]QFS36778.1 hypothetical protein BURCE16_08500 [Burkholderia cepacia]